MSLAANIRNGYNRVIGENDMVTIYFIQFDAVSCEENPFVSGGLLQRDLLNHKGNHFILIGLLMTFFSSYNILSMRNTYLIKECSITLFCGI